MRHIIVVNPVSGRKKGEKHGTVIHKLLNKNNIDSEIIVSNAPGDITKKTRELSAAEDCRFYSVGGDGTLNEIVSGIIGTNSSIVVLPCGTGNDFVKSVSEYSSTRKIIKSSIGKESSKVDVIKVNRDKYCINILSIGFDSMVGNNIDKFRNFPLLSGKMKYNLSIFYTLVTNRNFMLKLRDSNTSLKHNFTLVAISNGKYYGGGICPSPDALIDDAKLDICSIDSTSVIEKLFYLPKYKKGTHTRLNKVKIFTSNDITIVSNQKFPANVDGEVFYTNKIHAILIEKAINIVIIPKDI